MGSRFTGTGTAAPSWRGSAAQPRGRDDVTALVPRLGLVAAHDARSAALVERMLRTARLALPAARAEDGGFVFTLAGTPEPSGWRRLLFTWLERARNAGAGQAEPAAP